MSIILKCDNLSKSYTKKNKQLNILNNINFAFETGKFYAIMGESGSGKSTLIQILGLLCNFDSGNLYIDNNNTEKLKDKEKALIRNKKIGFVFQSFYLNPLLKAFENVMLPLGVNCKLSDKEKKNKALDVLKQVGLDERTNHFPFELSGGEQQRVAIARALVNDPCIILADEPTGSLDPKNSKIIFDILKDLAKQGKCIIVVSHSDDIKKYADEILYINNHSLTKKGGE